MALLLVLSVLAIEAAVRYAVRRPRAAAFATEPRSPLSVL